MKLVRIMKVFCGILCVVFLTIVPVIDSTVDHENLSYMGKKSFVPKMDELIKGSFTIYHIVILYL